MIRINKSLPPNQLTQFSQQVSSATWDMFRELNGGIDYRAIKELIFAEQHQLCAYCEVNTGSMLNNKRIEHFISKSYAQQYHTDWSNVFGVCLGGTEHANKIKYEIPANLSCDSHKSHIENTKQSTNRNWQGVILNPLTIPANHKLFVLKKDSGELHPNSEYCQRTTITPNNFNSTEELVSNTIQILNLNCLRLCTARREILFAYSKMVKTAKDNNDASKLEKFARSWLYGTYEFQTTRNIILRESPYLSKKFNL